MLSLRRAGILSIKSLATQARLAHQLPPLPYESNALEPIIKAEIMELHHQKHHAAYVNNLNAAEEKLKEAIAKCDVSAIIALQPALKFNGGGHLNHSIFWKNLSPSGGESPEALTEAVCYTFGSFDNLKSQLAAMANGIQGSGWAWLGYNKPRKTLQLAACANQDPLLATTGLIPLLGIDVWEHAYYLQYKNARAEYTKKIFEVVNWKDVGQRLQKAQCEL